MISIFVVEDETRVLETHLAMLRELGAHVVGSASTLESAFRCIKSTKPDLILLDVEIGSNTAFELLERFEVIDFKIIFITAHQKYALNAFRFSAIDFLLKPIDVSQLETSIEKVKQLLMKDQAVSIQALKHNLLSGDEDQKLILKTHDKIHVMKLEEIIRCESDQSYTVFHTLNDQIIVSRTLGYYEDLLSMFGFYRVHKSHLINLRHVVRIHKKDGGEVEMKNKDRVSISQRKRDDFFHKVDNLGIH